jgi:hypothetical protein
LDDDRRDGLVGHRDGVGVTRLMRCEASPHAGGRGRPAQVGADRRC